MNAIWTTDRRGLLKAGGAMLAGLAAGPRMAWSADGDTLRLRVTNDLQVLDPKGIIGELDKTKKIRVFKKKRRKQYRRTKGHRSLLTRVRITDIQV